MSSKRTIYFGISVEKKTQEMIQSFLFFNSGKVWGVIQNGFTVREEKKIFA